MQIILFNPRKATKKQIISNPSLKVGTVQYEMSVDIALMANDVAVQLLEHTA